MIKPQKKVLVFGATGLQGGAVINQLLKNHSNWKISGVSRDINSFKSKQLISYGVEMVQLDVENANVEVIKTTIGDNDSVFLVTDFWSYFQKEKEIGLKIVDAIVKTDVKYLVFSSLVEVSKRTNGRLSVPHFDMKNEIKEYCVKQSALKPTLTVSFVYCPSYYQNFTEIYKNIFAPKKMADGTYKLTLPMDPTSTLDIGDINDIGPIVDCILSDPDKYSQCEIPFGTRLNSLELTEIYEKVTGKTVTFSSMSIKECKELGFPGAEEMANMFQFFNEFGVFPGLDTTIAPKLTNITTFEEYLNKSNFSFD
eukprot:gene4599-5742_t